MSKGTRQNTERGNENEDLVRHGWHYRRPVRSRRLASDAPSLRPQALRDGEAHAPHGNAGKDAQQGAGAGHELCIISWCSKESTLAYDEAVRTAKLAWLAKHLPSVHWDIVKIVPYGQNKWETCKSGILFDDEERNRMAWEAGKAFTPETIFATLATLTR